MREETWRFLHAPKETLKAIHIQESRIRGFVAALPPNAVQYDRDKVQGGNGDQVAEYAERLARLNDRLDDLRRLYYEQLNDIEHEIGRLSNSDEREVLSMRYIAGMGYDEIAEKMPASLSKVYRLHRVGSKHLSTKDGSE